VKWFVLLVLLCVSQRDIDQLKREKENQLWL